MESDLMKHKIISEVLSILCMKQMLANQAEIMAELGRQGGGGKLYARMRETYQLIDKLKVLEKGD